MDALKRLRKQAGGCDYVNLPAIEFIRETLDILTQGTLESIGLV